MQQRQQILQEAAKLGQLRGHRATSELIGLKPSHRPLQRRHAFLQAQEPHEDPGFNVRAAGHGWRLR